MYNFSTLFDLVDESSTMELVMVTKRIIGKLLINATFVICAILANAPGPPHEWNVDFLI